MMKLSCVVLATVLAGAWSAAACTTIVVGKGASVTGRVLVGPNEDCGGGSTTTYRVLPRRTYPAGTVMPAAPGRAAIPQVTNACASLWWEARNGQGKGLSCCDCFFNERGVLVVSNNALGERYDDPSRLTDGGIFYNLRRAVAERAGSAHEAMEVITNLVSTWGYADFGRVYTVADRNEAWQVIVLYGKRFVARRCPDDGVTLTANCCTIRMFEPGDIRSADFLGLPSDYDFAKACQRKGTWKIGHYQDRWRNMVRMFGGKEWPNDDYPFAVRPLRKVDAEMLKKTLGSHYEGTAEVVPVGADGTRHGEDKFTPICRATTILSLVCVFGPEPCQAELHVADGSPCQHPYRTLCASQEFANRRGGSAAVKALDSHFP